MPVPQGRNDTQEEEMSKITAELIQELEVAQFGDMAVLVHDPDDTETPYAVVPRSTAEANRWRVVYDADRLEEWGHDLDREDAAELARQLNAEQ